MILTAPGPASCCRACAAEGSRLVPTDIFLHLDTIAGESLDQQFKGQVMLASFTSGVHLPVQIGPAEPSSLGSPTATELVITKQVDSASVRLAQALLTKASLSNGVISCRNPMNGLVFLTVNLPYVWVSDIQSAIVGAEDFPHEQVTLAFTRIIWTYVRKNPDGSTSQIKYGWDFVTESPI
jgi:type VI secretion system secreted protein Hcp